MNEKYANGGKSHQSSIARDQKLNVQRIKSLSLANVGHQNQYVIGGKNLHTITVIDQRNAAINGKLLESTYVQSEFVI